MPNAVVPLLLVSALVRCAPMPLHEPHHAASQTGASERALQYVRDHADRLQVRPDDVADIVVTSEAPSTHTGVTHVYLRQRFRGVDVVGGDLTVNVGRDGRVIDHAGQFVANLASIANRPRTTMSAAAAVTAALRHLELTAADVEPAPLTRRVYYPTSSGVLNLAWEVEVKTRDAQHVWVLTLEAVSGALFHKTDRVVSLKEGCA